MKNEAIARLPPLTPGMPPLHHDWYQFVDKRDSFCYVQYFIGQCCDELAICPTSLSFTQCQAEAPPPQPFVE